jgi:uncharacterized membrane protein YhiD involved in acid resistance
MSYPLGAGREGHRRRRHRRGVPGRGLIVSERDSTGRGQVLGLTTAASSWAAGAVGILLGAGLYLTAVASCVIVLLILEINRLPIYRRIDPEARRDEGDGWVLRSEDRDDGLPGQPGEERSSATTDQRATSTARSNTASSIGSVSLPVNVFC